MYHIKISGKKILFIVIIYFNVITLNAGVRDNSYERLMHLPIRELLDKLYKNEEVYIGIANHAKELGKLSTEIADREFSYITPSNDFKQSYIRRSLYKNNWRWEYPDRYVEHAQKAGQLIRIHGPISPQCSPWVKEDERTPEELEQLMNEYLKALYQRYNNKENVKWVDVVNETISPVKLKGGGNGYTDIFPGEWLRERKGSEQWESPWVKLGYDETSDLKVPVYIDQAFKLADEYAPNLKHIINQNGKLENIVWDKMKKLVGYLRDRGRRVDGLGWQAHIDTGWEKIPGNLEKLDRLIKWCHRNKLEFHITEMNVWMKDGLNEEAQADTYGKVLEVLLRNRKTGVVAINFWNVRDSDTSNPAWHGNIWQDNGKPRKAYTRIKEIIIKESMK